MGILVGIDLGTTYSSVARINEENGRAEIIPNSLGNPITPSVIAIMPDSRILHGEDAKEQQEIGYTEVASLFKRCMGIESYTLPLCGQIYSAEKLSALLLEGLVRDAEKVCGEVIDGAIITVPAYFRNKEREATIRAGEAAGIKVLGILNEPTAAAFAYGLHGQDKKQTILIYDLGGGTFDVTLAEVDGDSINIGGSDGDHALGGSDWDKAVSRWIIGKFKDDFGLDLSEDNEQLSMLAVLAENAKKRLTVADSADVVVSWQGQKAKYQLTRTLFDDVTSFMLHETASIIDRLYGSFAPQKTWQDVDGVILVGGSTRMRQVHDYIERMTGKPALRGVNVDEAVALGAAIRANQEADGSRRLLPGATRTRVLPGQDIEPIGRLIGSKQITDATTHALGMISESKDGKSYITDILIRKNTAIPAQQTLRRELRVSRKGDNELEVYLLQGEDPCPLNCEIAGKYVFSNIQYIEGGRTRIDISYRYDANGVINVEAVQTENGTKLTLRREVVPDDMNWVLRSPRENQGTGAMLAGEIYLVADLSGSMYGTPIEEAQKAMKRFVDDIDLSCFKIGIMGVADSVQIFMRPSGNAAELKQQIDRIMSDSTCGGANSAHPFGELMKAYSQTAEVRYAVVLADGQWSNQQLATSAARECHRAGIEIIGMGFGSADRAFLEDISSQKDLAIFTNLNELVGSFSKIAQVISDGGELIR